MFWLILAILASFSISMLVKSNETSGAQTQVVLAMNYVICAVLAGILTLVEGWSGVSRVTLLLGVGGGVLWISSFYLLMWGVRTYGVALAGSVSRLSLSVPVLFALLFLGEILSLSVAIGILGTFVAFYLLSPRIPKSGKPIDRRALWFFPVMVLVFGFTDGWVNLFNTLAPANEQFPFMIIIFTIAGCIGWGVVRVRKIRPNRQSLLRGALLGIPNFFSTYLLMLSLRAHVFSGRSAVVYALYSVAGVSLAFSAGALLWKESVSRRNVVGLFTAITAILLLNLA